MDLHYPSIKLLKINQIKPNVKTSAWKIRAKINHLRHFGILRGKNGCGQNRNRGPEGNMGSHPRPRQITAATALMVGQGELTHLTVAH